MTSAFDDDLSEELDRLRAPRTPARAAPAAPTAAAATEKRGWGGVLRDVGETVDDTVRAAADTASFGLLDRGLEYTGLEPGAIEKTKQARARSPWFSCQRFRR